MMKTFLLGLGAQKAGTTWLHDHLSRLPGTEFGFEKEYHLWDALHLPECRVVHRQRIARARGVLEARQGAFAGNATLWRTIAFEADPGLYVDYFCGLLSRPGVALTGDITPAYSGLPAAVLVGIREAFAARGVAVKALFLMRDPVERCWSAVRMARRQKRAGAPDHVFAETEEEALRRHYPTRLAEIRTRYDRTLAAMAEAFAPQDRVTGLYERLFEADEVARICGALGLAPGEPDLSRRLNASAKGAALPETLRRAIARHYAPAFTAAAEQWGASEIARLWPSARLICEAETGPSHPPAPPGARSGAASGALGREICHGP